MNATRIVQRGLMWGIGACLVTSAALRIGAHADAAVAATEKPTEDINDLILKVIDAPTKKEKRRADREAR